MAKRGPVPGATTSAAKARARAKEYVRESVRQYVRVPYRDPALDQPLPSTDPVPRPLTDAEKQELSARKRVETEIRCRENQNIAKYGVPYISNQLRPY